TVLVSSLIPAGTVFRIAANSMPFDHTSILKTIETRWNLPSLTARDGAASGVGDVLTLTAPRTDDPLRGVTVPVAAERSPDEDQPSHLQEVHAELVAQLPVPDEQGGTHPSMPKLRTSSEYAEYIRARTQAWRASRNRISSPTKKL
ncbi:MAG TPA: hypothetical protein VF283_08230, partial [Bryobacteraceae bacterium]